VDNDCSSRLSIEDLFAFLDEWFISHPRSDFNADGIHSVQDIFESVAACFVGC
jgi:hypothetical protein